MRRKGTRDGLTIIEVLLAFFILGTGMAVIMQGIALGLRVRRESAESQQLSIAAVDRLNRLIAGTEEPEETGGAEGEIRWRVERFPYQPGGEDLSREIDEVRIIVEGPSGRSWEITSLLPAAGEEP